LQVKKYAIESTLDELKLNKLMLET
jgi:hypothetical protein